MISANLPATPCSAIPQINTIPIPPIYSDRKGCIISLFFVLQMHDTAKQIRWSSFDIVGVGCQCRSRVILQNYIIGKFYYTV